MLFSGGSSGSAAPTGAAGGDLDGTYPNPTIDPTGTGLTKADNQTITGVKTISRGASGNDALKVMVTGDTYPRLNAKASGNIQFGPGGGSDVDVEIARVSAGRVGVAGAHRLVQAAAPTAGSDVVNKTYADGKTGSWPTSAEVTHDTEGTLGPNVLEVTVQLKDGTGANYAAMKAISFYITEAGAVVHDGAAIDFVSAAIGEFLAYDLPLTVVVSDVNGVIKFGLRKNSGGGAGTLVLHVITPSGDLATNLVYA